jgi:hypothetical protein
MGRRITEEDKEVIRQMISIDGASLQETADVLSGDSNDPVSKQAVHYHVQKMGLEPPDDDEREERLLQANELLSEDSDMNIKELSEHLDCSWACAKSVMEELGYYEEAVPFIDKVDSTRLIRLYVVEDMSLADLNRVFPDVSEMTISKTLKELGVPMRPQGASTGKLRRDWRKEAIVKMGLGKDLARSEAS